MSQPPGFLSSNKHKCASYTKLFMVLSRHLVPGLTNFKLLFLASILIPASVITLCFFRKCFCCLYISLCRWHYHHTKLIHSLVQLNYVFSFKDLGDLDYFLEIEVQNQPDWSLILTQSKYIRHWNLNSIFSKNFKF